jgi:hypothetical protein
MAFNGMTLTAGGRSLQAKVQAGATLAFTQIKIGDGRLSAGESLDFLNDLIGPKLVVPIQDVSVIGDGTCRVRGVLTNTGLAAGFFVREIGVFATDPDLGEILYAIANAGDECDYLPAGGGAVAIEHVLDIVISVGNAANVTAVINESAVLATKADLSDHVGAGGNAHALATTAVAGFMSEADKAKLDGINAESLSAAVNAHKTVVPLDHPDDSVTDAKIGNRTISDTAEPADDTAQLGVLLSNLANMIKQITGKNSWRTAPATALETLNNCDWVIAASLDTNGYIKFKSGLIIQWGMTTTGTTSFPTAFSSGVYRIVLNDYDHTVLTDGAKKAGRTYYTGVIITGFQAKFIYPQYTHDYSVGSWVNVDAPNCDYIAIGA